MVSSFQTQYGIRIYSEVFKTMKWDEFKALVSGLSADTPLGKIVGIRAENDKDTLKRFTKEQRRIRDAWRSKSAQKMDQATFEQEMFKLEKMFEAMAK
ncbi:Gp15 family bacteriophage protein [Anaerocolumna sp. AGMB13025]|nr:Gp15 family bacteriophage protein [Anaerocolumna sp. AGMB13025]WFR60257.1 Gp15 family bacteriophage protein [Anaerocolumna sp. AGMB13025]